MNLVLDILKKNKVKIFIVGLLSIIISIISLLIPLFSKQIFNQSLINKNIKMVAVTAIGLIILNVIYYLLEYINQKTLVKIEKNATVYVRKRVIDNIISKPLKFFEKYDTEYLVTRINESAGIGNIISSDFFKFFLSIFTMIVALIYLFSKAPFFGWISIGISIIYVFVMLLPLMKIFKISNETMDENAEYNKKLYSAVQGISELKQYNQVETFSSNILSSVEKIAILDAEQSNKINFNFNFLQACNSIINITVSVLIAISIVKGELTVGDYFLITQYVSLVNAPVLMFQSFLVMCLFPFLAGIRVERLMQEEEKEKISGYPITDIKKILLENISFSYSDKEVLKHISFEMGKNDVVQIIGKNGSGKSTLLKIIMGLYNPQSGNILINGLSLNEYNLSEYRNLVGVIPQKVFLFDSTIKENIRIGNTALSDEKFENYLKEFEKKGFLKNLDINKIVIDNGKNLSGGQIKMIALCRVLLRNPKLLILDEATTGMDKELSHSFLSIINNLSDIAIIYISHIKEDKIKTTKELYL